MVWCGVVWCGVVRFVVCVSFSYLEAVELRQALHHCEDGVGVRLQHRGHGVGIEDVVHQRVWVAERALLEVVVVMVVVMVMVVMVVVVMVIVSVLMVMGYSHPFSWSLKVSSQNEGREAGSKIYFTSLRLAKLHSQREEAKKCKFRAGRVTSSLLGRAIVRTARQSNLVNTQGSQQRDRGISKCDREDEDTLVLARHQTT